MRPTARNVMSLRRMSPVLALLAGVGQAWSLADATGQAHGAVQMLCMAGVCILLLAEQAHAQGAHAAAPTLWLRGARLGWWFATGWLCATFWWLYISMHVYGGMPSALAVIAVVALAGALALYYAAACGVWLVLMQGVTGAALVWRGSACWAALWTLAELMRGQWFTGFPWGAIGYAHVDSGLQGYAAWVGVYGVGGLAAAGAMALANGFGSGIILTMGADLAPADARNEFLASYRLITDIGVAAAPPLLSAITIATGELAVGMASFGALGIAGGLLMWRYIPRFIPKR